ncbi:MAG: ferritin family protein [Desulfobacteraceae bacterium]|nr:ferritin family protein [Desulfobacteraceae bacterium]
MEPKEFESIISAAINNEIDAHKFYLAAAETVADPHLKKMFHDFAEEEKGHQRILENVKSNKKANVHFASLPDYKVSDTMETPPLTMDMKPADAIALAMKNEEAAMQQYTQLADACTDADKKKIFLELAAMERQHKFKMEKAFVDIGYPEVW